MERTPVTGGTAKDFLCRALKNSHGEKNTITEPWDIGDGPPGTAGFTPSVILKHAVPLFDEPRHRCSFLDQPTHIQAVDIFLLLRTDVCTSSTAALGALPFVHCCSLFSQFTASDKQKDLHTWVGY